MNTNIRIIMTAPIAAAIIGFGMAPAQADPADGIDLQLNEFAKPNPEVDVVDLTPFPQIDPVEPVEPPEPVPTIVPKLPPVGIEKIVPELPHKVPDLTQPGGTTNPAGPEANNPGTAPSTGTTGGATTTAPSSTQQAAPTQPAQQQPKRPKVTVKPRITVVAPKQPTSNITLEVKAPKAAQESEPSAQAAEPVTAPVADVVTQEAAAPAPAEAPAVPMPVLLALGAAVLGVAAAASYRAGQRKSI